MADEDPAIWRIYQGQFSYDETAIPDRDLSNTKPEPLSLPATFTGLGLTRSGFTAPVTLDVTLDLICLGPWCGGGPGFENVIVFLKDTADGPVFQSTPCPDWVFQPTEDAADRLLACVTDGCPAG